MTDKKILEVFYNEFIPETQKGKIDCYFRLNIGFSFVVDNQIVSKYEEDQYNGVLIPTLKVTNKEMFDRLLVEYVKRAREFYDNSNFSFLNDLNDLGINNVDDVKERYLIKYIIGTLFANASLNDFENPLNFLKSRIEMFDNKILKDDEICLGYIDSIGAKIYVKEEKSSIKTETPYQIKGYLQFDDGYILKLPEIYCGCTKDKYQIYGIQKKDSNNGDDEKNYLKQIRKGYIAKIKGAPEHFFLAVMLSLSLCKDKEIEIVPFLIERWNAKKVAMYYKANRNPNLLLDKLEEEQEKIQSNMTDIFVHYFTKMEDVSNGIEFLSIPFDTDTSLNFKINDDFESRCVAFNELIDLADKYKFSGKSK